MKQPILICATVAPELCPLPCGRCRTILRPRSLTAHGPRCRSCVIEEFTASVDAVYDALDESYYVDGEPS